MKENLNSMTAHNQSCDCFDCDVLYDRRITTAKLAQMTGVSMSKYEKDRYFGKGRPFEKCGNTVRYRARTVRDHLEACTRKSTSDTGDRS